MFQTKFVEKIKTYVLCSVFFFPEILAVYEIMLQNIVELGRRKMTQDIACWIPRATDTHSVYVTFIDFSNGHFCSNNLQYYMNMYIACLAVYSTAHTMRYEVMYFNIRHLVVCFNSHINQLIYSVRAHYIQSSAP